MACLEHELEKNPLRPSASFTKEESGICITHIARHFDRTILEERLSEETMPKEKGFQLHHLLSLEENMSTIPENAKKAATST